MTSSINYIQKEPDRMFSTMSSSLPAISPNTRSSSLPTKSSSLPANLPSTRSSSLPTNLPNKRSASLPTNSVERRKYSGSKNSSFNEKDSRRYGTYDLNWDDFEYVDDYIDLEDVQPTHSDSIIIHSPTSLIQEEPSSSLPLIISPPISPPMSPIAEIKNDYDYSDNEEQYLFPGGITVTTVRVVQIDECQPEKRSSKIPLPKNKVLVTKEINNTYNTLKKQITIKRPKKSTTNNNISAQTIKERRKTRIYNNVDQDDIAQFKMINNINNERKFNSVVRRTSSKRRGATQYRRSYKKRQIQEERMVPALTSNPFYTNDPTDMEDDDNIQSPIIPWVPVTNGPPKLLHASLIPLSQIIKKMEATSSAEVPHLISKRKTVDSISAPRPKRPSQLFRQNLLEQSIALSFNEVAMKGFASQSAQSAQSEQSAAQSTQPTHKAKRKLVESIWAPKPKRVSQLFRENLLEQSVAMSFNEAVMGRNVLASQSTQSARSTHKLEREHIESISAPKPKRPSQLFREVLLEESIAMSLDDVIMGRNVFATHGQSVQSLNTKIPRRRFTRRGSNAKFSKFRKEKAEKKKGNIDDQEQQLKQETVNPMVSSRILEADELKIKVEEQLRKKAILQSPQPPPRRFTQSPTESQREVIVQRRPKSARPDKRLIKLEPSYRESIQPFPAHLARRNKSLRWH